MKKVLSMILAIAMMLSMVSVSFAAETGIVSATVDGPAQRGGEVEVTINFDSNPGFLGGTLEVCYPEELTYKESEDTGLFGKVSFYAVPDKEENVVMLSWENMENEELITATGAAVVMTFHVSAAASSFETYPIAIEKVKMGDARAQKVPFTATGCDITVEGSAGYMVRATAGENGTISPLGDTQVEKGGNVVYTITADEGYHVDDIQVNHVSVMFDPASEVTYTMKNITDVRTIHATFAAHTPVGDNGNCEDVVT